MDRRLLIILIALSPAPLAAGFLSPQPLALWNSSPSEPEGLYLRDQAGLARGRLIAFRPPAGAYPYVAEAMPARARSSILKTIVAGEGDFVCARMGRLAINGHVRGAIAQRDRRGRLLPHWDGCRQLRSDEYFVFSSRVPNSFDSRYYGPVRRSEVIGVYRAAAREAGA